MKLKKGLSGLLTLKNRSIFKTTIGLLVTLSLSSCQVAPQAETVENPTSTPSVTDTNPIDHNGNGYPSEQLVQQCTKKGGKYSRQGRAGAYRCIVPYADAGKSCQDASDCEGNCKAKQGDFFPAGAPNVEGQCSSDNSPFGCFQTIENGVALPALCVD